MQNDERNFLEVNPIPNITLKIQEIGNYCILGKDFEKKNYPNETIINGIKQNITNYIYNFTKIDNKVELIWYYKMKDCKYMFKGCSNINDINFSNFDTSQVTYMVGMFEGCSSLLSLNITNFDTSKVTSISSMFKGCSNLTSLDITNFNTSLVLSIRYMFNDCSSLTSLDLSNFNTSKVERITQLFYNCKKLQYINIINFNEINLSNKSYSDIFFGLPDNVKICINKNNTSNYIFPQIKQSFIIECLDQIEIEYSTILQKKI